MSIALHFICVQKSFKAIKHGWFSNLPFHRWLGNKSSTEHHFKQWLVKDMKALSTAKNEKSFQKISQKYLDDFVISEEMRELMSEIDNTPCEYRDIFQLRSRIRKLMLEAAQRMEKEQVLYLYRRMRECKIPTSRGIFNTLISSFMVYKDTDNLKSILHDVATDAIVLENKTIERLGWYCHLHKQYELLFKLIEYCKVNNVNARTLYEGRMEYCCDRGDTEGMESVMQELLKTPTLAPIASTYLIAMKHYAKNGDFRKVVRTFRDMLHRRVHPTLRVMEWLGQFVDANGIGSLLQASYRIEDEPHFKSILYFLAFKGNWAAALKLYSQLRSAKVPLHAAVYHRLLRRSAQEKDMDTIAHLLVDMKEENIVPTVPAWNQVMCAYARTNQIQKLFETLKEMKESGLNPNTATYNTLLQHFIRTRHTKAVPKVYQQMLKDHVEPDGTTLKLMLAFYGQTGDRASLKELFRKSENKLVSKAVILQGVVRYFASNQNLHEMMLAYYKVEKTGLIPNTATYADMIMAFAKANNLETALELFATAKEKKIVLNVDIFNGLMLAYGKRLDFIGMMKIFKRMMTLLIAPSVQTFVILVRCYFRTRDTKDLMNIFQLLRHFQVQPCGHFFGALFASFMRTEQVHGLEWARNTMKEMGVEPDYQTYTWMVVAYAMKGDVENTLKLIRYMKSMNMPIVPRVFVALIDCHGSTGNFEKMWKVFRRLRKKNAADLSVLYDHMFYWYYRHHDLEGMSRVYAKMRKQGCPATFTILVQMMFEHGKQDLAKALDLFKKLKKKFKPTLDVYSKLIACHSIHADVQGLLKTFQEMLNDGITPNVRTYNSLLYGMRNDGSRLMMYFHKMKSYGINPNQETFDHMFDGLRREKNADAMMELLPMVKECGLSISHWMYGCMLDCYGRQLWDAEEMLRIMDRMTREGITLSQANWLSVMYTYFQRGEFNKVVYVFEEMKRQSCMITKESPYVVVLRSLGKLHDLKKMMEIFEEYKQSGLPLVPSVYGAVMHAFAMANKPEDMWQLFLEMEQLQVPYSPHIFDTLIVGWKRARKPRKMIEAFCSMTEKNLRPSLSSYLATLGAYAQIQEKEGMDRVVEHMAKNLVPPDVRVFNSYLAYYAKEGNVDGMLKTYAGLKRMSTPSFYTFMLLLPTIVIHNRFDQLWQIVEDMKSIKFHPHQQETLLDALQRLKSSLPNLKITKT